MHNWDEERGEAFLLCPLITLDVHRDFLLSPNVHAQNIEVQEDFLGKS